MAEKYVTEDWTWMIPAYSDTPLMKQAFIDFIDNMPTYEDADLQP